MSSGLFAKRPANLDMQSLPRSCAALRRIVLRVGCLAAIRLGAACILLIRAAPRFAGAIAEQNIADGDGKKTSFVLVVFWSCEPPRSLNRFKDTVCGERGLLSGNADSHRNS